MVKRTLFIMTHLGSGWEKLGDTLKQDRRFDIFQTGSSYHHPEDVKSLTNLTHRSSNSASIWTDVIFHNKDFTMKRLCDHYRFVFWSCPLEECIEELCSNHKYGIEQAKDYWSCRMSGLKLYHKRSKGSLWNPKLEVDLVLASVLR